METKIVAKAILVNPVGEILVLRRSPIDTNRPGTIDFPGGGVEMGEDALSAVTREIKEETGIVTKQSELSMLYAMTSEPNASGHIITRLLFAGKVSTNEVQLSFEHDEHHWARPESVVEEFDNTSWSVGLQFAIKHNLISKD
jgi:mutator protein MutT